MTDRDYTARCYGTTSIACCANFAAKQRAMLAGLKSNFRGLHLEFRIRTGSAGWAFHDRFLIFPGTDGARRARTAVCQQG